MVLWCEERRKESYASLKSSVISAGVIFYLIVVFYDQTRQRP